MPKEIQVKVYEALKLLEEFPFVKMDIKKLKGREKIFRIRLGKYRILFVLGTDKIYVLDINIRGRIEY